MKRRMKGTSFLLGLLIILILIGFFSDQGNSAVVPGIAYTRYKWGSDYPSPGCCNTIFAQDYDCLGRRIEYAPGQSCYNTNSGSTSYGTCFGGCIRTTCGGLPTKICVIDNPYFGCNNCDVYLQPLPGSPPAKCNRRVNPECGKKYGCGSPFGFSCYTEPYDASEDLDSGYLCDRRTPQMIAAGCYPPDLQPPCDLKIKDLQAHPLVINSSFGSTSIFSAQVTGGGGSEVQWTLATGERRFSGRGTSVWVAWDGKDVFGKMVGPGQYEVELNAQTKDGKCGDSKKVLITVTDQPVSCPLLIDFGSLANVASGNLYHSQRLFFIPNSKLLSDFILSYNSHQGNKIPLGMGWTHSFHLSIKVNNDGSLTLSEGDGSRTVLYANGEFYTPKNSPYPALLKNPDGTHLLQFKSGLLYLFDPSGKITRMEDRNGNALLFAYDASGNLESLSDVLKCFSPIWTEIEGKRC